MQMAQIEIKNYRFEYAEPGKGEPLVLDPAQPATIGPGFSNSLLSNCRRPYLCGRLFENGGAKIDHVAA
jgi:hypothetical protein